jgi:hypothetical protein
MSDARLTFSMTEAISGDQRLSKLIQTAHQLLLDSLGISTEEVREDWSLEKDPKGRTLVRLKLSDSFVKDGVKDEFAQEVLENPGEMRYRLHRLWGDLLQDRSHIMLKKLMDGDGSEGGGNGP